MLHKAIAQNTLFQIVTRVISSVVGLLITLLIASALGASGYGDYTKIVTLVSLFYLVVDFGLNALFLQEKEHDQQLWSLVFFRFILAIGLIIVVNGGLLLFSLFPEVGKAYPTYIRNGILLYSLTIVTQAVIISATAIFQKNLRYKYLLYATILGSCTALGLILLVYLVHGGLLFYLVALVTGAVVTALSSLFSTREIKISNVSIQFGKQLFLQSIPVGLMLIANLIYFRIDIILLSFFVSATQVGLYGFSYRFFDFFLALPLFLSNSLYPILLNLKNSRNGSQIASQYAYVYGASGIACMLIAYVFAPLLGLVKPEFIGSVFSFRILILSLPLFFFTSYLQWILIAKKELHFLLIVYILTGMLNIIGNIVCIPTFGYVASAVITDICELMVFVLLFAKFLINRKSYV